jgi:hypothetical protein
MRQRFTRRDVLKRSSAVLATTIFASPVRDPPFSSDETILVSETCPTPAPPIEFGPPILKAHLR